MTIFSVSLENINEAAVRINPTNTVVKNYSYACDWIALEISYLT